MLNRLSPVTLWSWFHLYHSPGESPGGRSSIAGIAPSFGLLHPFSIMEGTTGSCRAQPEGLAGLGDATPEIVMEGKRRFFSDSPRRHEDTKRRLSRRFLGVLRALLALRRAHRLARSASMQASLSVRVPCNPLESPAVHGLRLFFTQNSFPVSNAHLGRSSG